MPASAYQLLMDAGFRRSGRIFYQPVCPGCRECRAVRVPVARFCPGKSLRRVERRNLDLDFRIGEPELTQEKARLYARYLAARHDGTMSGSPEELGEFLYRSPTESVEFCYRDPSGRLLAVGLCDVTPLALSSVYFYFAPEEARRSLGTFGSLAEILTARSWGLAFYYPGFWVADSPKMAYKSRLRPFEVLGTDGQWREGDGADPCS